MTTITPFLMFTGAANEAIDFYTRVFPDSAVLNMAHYGDEVPDRAGTVQLAQIRLAGQVLSIIDSPDVHAFTFTPAVSFSVGCETAEEVDRLFATLSEGGQVLMPLDSYPFSPRYAWINDRFGVSWQIIQSAAP